MTSIKDMNELYESLKDLELITAKYHIERDNYVEVTTRRDNPNMQNSLIQSMNRMLTVRIYLFQRLQYLTPNSFQNNLKSMEKYSRMQFETYMTLLIVME